MNNRQAGRRRGRGGQRSQGNPQGGNRIDNRARGNANQLHEKYKNLARDAQMQGDRVNTEYYLQFADHYFRVLNETRSRTEEHQRRQRDDQDDNEIDDDGDEQRADDQRRGRQRQYDEDGGDRQPRRQSRYRDDEGEGNERDRQDRAPVANDEADEAPAPKRRGRPRKQPAGDQGGDQPAAIEADRLPPSLSSVDAGEEKPRRRRGRPPAGDAVAAE